MSTVVEKMRARIFNNGLPWGLLGDAREQEFEDAARIGLVAKGFAHLQHCAIHCGTLCMLYDTVSLTSNFVLLTLLASARMAQ